jgi:hypothetical protein
MPSLAIFFAAALAQLPALREAGRLSDPEIQEASALEASLQFPGVFWTVPDSGNPPHLTALDNAGQVLATYRVAGAVNLDWECLALDGEGNLYIADIGNNAVLGRPRLPQRWVYVVREPDPRIQPKGAAPGDLRTLPLERTILVRYPEAPVDIEAAFAWRDEVFFISKTPGSAVLYRLPNDESADPVTLVKVTDLPGLDRATGAALSPDGRRLAVCTYHEVWIYAATGGDDFSLTSVRPIRRIPFRAPGVEACSWDGDDLLLLNEAGRLYRLR